MADDVKTKKRVPDLIVDHYANVYADTKLPRDTYFHSRVACSHIRSNRKGTYAVVGGLRYRVEKRQMEPTEWERQNGREPPHGWVINDTKQPKLGNNYYPQNYSEARACYDCHVPWKNDPHNGDRPLRAARKSTHRVRLHPNGDVGFIYHGAEHVVFHPNGDITLKRADCYGASQFMADYTPDGVGAWKPYEGVMNFRSIPKSDDDQHRYVWRNFGKFNVVQIPYGWVRLTPIGGDAWRIVDSADLVPITTVSTDRRVTRDVCKKYKFRDAQIWLKTIERLSDASGENLYEQHHIRYEPNYALDALREGDFVEMMKWLDPCETQSCYGYVGYRSKKKLTAFSVEKLRRYAYKQAGAYTVSSQLTMTVGQFESNRQREALTY